MKNKLKILLVGTLVVSSLFVGCQQAEKTEESGKDTVQTDELKAEIDIPKEYEEIAGYLKKITGVKLPYFGGYDLEEQQIIVMSPESENAILWSGKDGKITRIKTSTIAQEKKSSTFAEGEYDGVKTTFIMQEDDPEMAFRIAVHEGYHFYGQGWLDDVKFGDSLPRGTMHNENIKARVLMNLADDSLRTYMENEDGDGIGKALYFINQMRKNHADDLDGNLYTSLSEGSANFIENLYVAVAKNPELKGDLAGMAKMAYESNKINIVDDFHDKGSEYYQIGSLPMYYFAMEGKGDMLERVKSGMHPLELLNFIATEKETTGDEGLIKAIRSHYEDSNKRVSQYIEKMKAQSASDEYVFIKLPQQAFTGSVQFGEFINFKDGEKYQTLNADTTAEGMQGQGKVELINQDTMDVGNYQYYGFYVKKSDVNAKDLLNIDTENVKIDSVKYTESDGSLVLE